MSILCPSCSPPARGARWTRPRQQRWHPRGQSRFRSSRTAIPTRARARGSGSPSSPSGPTRSIQWADRPGRSRGCSGTRRWWGGGRAAAGPRSDGGDGGGEKLPSLRDPWEMRCHSTTSSAHIPTYSDHHHAQTLGEPQSVRAAPLLLLHAARSERIAPPPQNQPICQPQYKSVALVVAWHLGCAPTYPPRQRGERNKALISALRGSSLPLSTPRDYCASLPHG